MLYKFDFSFLLEKWPAFLNGAWLTIQLTVLSIALGFVVGTLCAVARVYGGRVLRLLIGFYVELIRNTPLLVQIFIVYFGLSSMGLKLSAEASAVIALVVNMGAYTTEIMRAGFISVQRTEMEAAETIGMSLVQQIRFVIVPHIAKTIYPALANFFIVVLVMGTSVGAVVGVDELTGTAINISTENYRWIEMFIVVACIYVVLTFIASLSLALLGRWAFRVKVKVF